MSEPRIESALARSQALLDWKDGLYHNDNPHGSPAYKAYAEQMRKMSGQIRRAA